MARNREKKALYEVMSRSWHKPAYDKTLEEVHPAKPEEEKQPAVEFPAPAPRKAIWLNKPRFVQLNAGRIEISIPYQLAIAVALGLIVLVLIAFRLGQMASDGPKEVAPVAKVPTNTQKAVPKVTAGMPQMSVPVKEKTLVPSAVKKVEPVAVEPKGDNRIVIQSYQLRADLEPVKQYFAGFGIETEITKIGNWYYLVTKNKYDNPEKQGTDGYLAKQKIIELGAKYKAPPAHETFGSKPFSDAYGKKFDE
ncbi:MAG: hypothetical protein PHY02_06630 [Phycisphaerae bacterium]|nr:hypothetical protein [Phycisphaerae bacterium]